MMPRFSLLDALNSRRLRFFEGLDALYRATGDLARALTFLADRLGATREGRAARRGAAEIAAGRSLADALGCGELRLTPVERGLLEVGELSGTLEQAVAAIISDLRRARRAAALLISRLAYPVFVLHFAGIVFVFIQSLQTGFLWAWTALYFGLLYGPVAAGWCLLRKARHSPGLRRSLLDLPVLGAWWRSRMQSRFAFAIGHLYTAGLPIGRSLAIAAEGFADPTVAGEIREAALAVERGDSLTAHIPATLDDSVLRDAISIGEHAGSLSEQLERAWAFYEERANVALARIGRLAYGVTFAVAAVVVFALALRLYGGLYAGFF